MFRLHERTRIFLCRAAFLLFGVVPTLAIVAWTWHYRSPQYIEARREEWVAVLSDKLGFDVAIGRLSYPDWNTALLENVSLLDPETKEVRASARDVELTWSAGKWEIRAGYPQVDAASLETLFSVLHDRLLRLPGERIGPVDFSTSVISFRQADREQTFSHVAASIAPAEHGRTLKLQFQIDGVPARQPWELVLERHSREQPPHTIATFHTGQHALPLETIRTLFPWLAALGNEATYQGEVRTIHFGGESLVECAGQLKQVDLEQVVKYRLPHYRLSGKADLQLQALQLHNGTIVLAKGSLRTQQGGEIGQNLLDALGQKLDLAPRQPPKIAPFARVRYSHLAFAFQLDGQGLTIAGDADPASSGVVMASAAAGPLLMESTQPVVPAVALIDAFSPPSQLKIPATPEARSWIEILPPPALLPKDEVLQAGPRTNLRLRK